MSSRGGTGFVHSMCPSRNRRLRIPRRVVQEAFPTHGRPECTRNRQFFTVHRSKIAGILAVNPSAEDFPEPKHCFSPTAPAAFPGDFQIEKRDLPDGVDIGKPQAQSSAKASRRFEIEHFQGAVPFERRQQLFNRQYTVSTLPDDSFPFDGGQNHILRYAAGAADDSVLKKRKSPPSPNDFPRQEDAVELRAYLNLEKAAF